MGGSALARPAWVGSRYTALMIRALPTIKLFGVFEDFRWPADLSEFKQFNLLYGWNYSGKTTLSRVLRCFEVGECHHDFGSAQAQLRDTNGTVHDFSSFAPSIPIRVFNSDFVKDNLSFDSGKANAVLLLGADDIAKQRELDFLKVELGSVRSHMKGSETAQIKAQSEVDGLLTKCARDNIKNPLAIPSFDKTKLEQLVKQVSNNVDEHILSDVQYQSQLTLHRSAEKKAPISIKVLSLTSVGGLHEKTRALLARAVAVKKHIPELEGDSTLERWVNSGRSLHRDSISCRFCGNGIPSDLLSTLNEYFSSEYDALITDLDKLLREVDAALAQLVRFDDVAVFYSDLTESHRTPMS